VSFDRTRGKDLPTFTMVLNQEVFNHLAGKAILLDGAVVEFVRSFAHIPGSHNNIRLETSSLPLLGLAGFLNHAAYPLTLDFAGLLAARSRSTPEELSTVENALKELIGIANLNGLL